MARERLYLYDTTLRDGAQTQGVDFSVEDKKLIATALDKIGVSYVEGGWPGANPTDTAFFSSPPPFAQATFTAFGMTRRPGRSVSNDPGLSALFEADTKAVCLVGKSWDFQVKVALEISLEENLELIRDSIAEIVRRDKEAMLDAEHFFDGYKANPDYALECLKAAHESGARWIVLCDTNGGTMPDEVERIVGEIAKVIPGSNLGIHAHNDTENAVANSLAAVRAGARQVQGTINGLGERCGNANLISLIASFVLKPTYRDLVDTGISEEGLKHVTSLSRLLDETLNRAPQRNAPYVGASAFAHKGGLHVSAVMKDPKTYEHIDPAKVGNKRQILVSDQSGVANIVARLKEIGVEVDPKNPKLKRLLEVVKEREFDGYSYDGAAASFELLARRTLGEVPVYFTVDSFRALVERRFNAKGELVTISEATVKLTIDGEEIMSVGEGNGPVNALDAALRKDMGRYSSYIDDLRLVDYKVRILNQGTGDGTNAVTRVMIESADGKGERWFTVGVSPNIVDASFQAMSDSLTYKLYRDGAPAGTN